MTEEVENQDSNNSLNPESEPVNDKLSGGAQNPAADPAAEKPRRVAKTLMFNVPTAEAVDAYAAASAAAVEQAGNQSAKEEVVNAADREAEVAQKQAARRVAKTLLFSEINLEKIKAAAEVAQVEADLAQKQEQQGTQEQQGQNQPVFAGQPTEKKTTAERKVRRIAKTLMDDSADNFPGEALFEPVQTVLEASTPAESIIQSASSERPPEFLKVEVQKPRQYVAKTMLDHSILWDTVQKFEAKMEVKVAEQILERANEPVKPIIEIVCKKQAMACGFSWPETETRERFKICNKCNTPVYNFSGLEQPEADELIFQRENKRKATLYKRADGKYMTVDCPVEVKRRKDLITMAIGGLIAAACLIGLLISLPKPKPQLAAPVPTELPGTPHAPVAGSQLPGTPGAASGAAPGAANDGSFHMVNGQRVYPNGTAPSASATATFPAPVTTPAGTTDSDESGQFWQYDGPPQGKSDAPPPVYVAPPTPQPGTGALPTNTPALRPRYEQQQPEPVVLPPTNQTQQQ